MDYFVRLNRDRVCLMERSAARTRDSDARRLSAIVADALIQYQSLALIVMAIGFAALELIVTPNYHRVHHRAVDEPAKNLGNLLTVWDRLLGTYEAADQSTVVRCGLVEPRPGLIRMMLGI